MYLPYRRVTQLLVFCLMFVVPILNIHEIYFITGTFFAINFGGLGVADPSVILQAIFAAGEFTLPLLASVVFPIFMALLLGRVWCGWLCPFLFVSEGVDCLRGFARKIFPGKTYPSALAVQSSFKANLIRFSFLLAGTAVAGALGMPVLNYINAPAVMSTEAMIIVKERFVSLEFGFIVALLGIQFLLAPKIWCRVFCPTGSVIALFRLPITVSVVSSSRNQSAPCCKETSCVQACPMGLNPYMESENLLCVNCGKCIDSCAFDKLHFSGFVTRIGTAKNVK